MTTAQQTQVLWCFAALIVILMLVIYYTDRRYTTERTKVDEERTRNDHLVTRIHNLQQLARLQDHLIAAKIEMVLEEGYAAREAATARQQAEALPAAEGDHYNVDDIIMRMQYCYDCQGIRGPKHFLDTQHRTTPAPELYGPEAGV
jgi:hypothetical protein